MPRTDPSPGEGGQALTSIANWARMAAVATLSFMAKTIFLIPFRNRKTAAELLIACGWGGQDRLSDRKRESELQSKKNSAIKAQKCGVISVVMETYLVVVKG